MLKLYSFTIPVLYFLVSINLMADDRANVFTSIHYEILHCFLNLEPQKNIEVIKISQPVPLDRSLMAR